METVSMTQTFDATPDAISEQLADKEAYMRAGGFDAVTTDGNHIRIENGVGIATMELEIEFIDREDSELVYQQVEGIFEAMETRVTLEETNNGTEVTMTTDFELGIDLIGGLLDSTVIKRQRKREISNQFEWLERELAEG